MASISLSPAQEEEKEVLLSIYESDPCFKETGSGTFQYRVGEQGEPNAYLVEVKWTENYPEDLPEISMDSFFNSHMSPSSKSAIIGSIKNELQDLIGNPMTYTIFEYIRDNRDELSSHISAAPDDVVKTEEVEKMEEESEMKTAKLKPTQLSKAAKRRQADRLNAQGELPRGWNWIDIIKHVRTSWSLIVT